MSAVSTLDYIDTHRQQFEQELFELLQIPSISADSAFRADVQRAAQWLHGRFKSLGLAADIIETEGHPIVFAESPPVPGAPVALVYGHYDVQPPDPLEQWTTPPFEPTIRDGKVFARGSTDDKGQMYTHVASAAAWLATQKGLPLQLKFLIEGEEEVGSENLEKFLTENSDQLACDCVVISDTSQFAPGVPAITYGLRGIIYYEITVRGPNRDLHSGVFGGAVANPAIALAKMLAGLIDDQGRILLPDFYEGVDEVSEDQRRQLALLPFDEVSFREDLGVTALVGEEGYSTLERRWARPSWDVHGLTSGYQGEGAKTVLPAEAYAKFSFRLVPSQDPHRVTAALRGRLEELTPPGVTIELKDHHGSPGIVVPMKSPYLQAAADAIETGFSSRPVFIREGGSIPIVNAFAEALHADVLLLGWGQNDDNPHSPNEKFSLDDFHRGIRASAALWGQLASIR